MRALLGDPASAGAAGCSRACTCKSLGYMLIREQAMAASATGRSSRQHMQRGRLGAGSRRQSSPGMALNTTQRIRSIGRSAARDAHIRERLQHWKGLMRTRGALSGSPAAGRRACTGRAVEAPLELCQLQQAAARSGASWRRQCRACLAGGCTQDMSGRASPKGRQGAGEELRAALEEWQDRRADESSKACTETRSRLTTGFLDGSHPVVDCYELKVLSLRAAGCPVFLLCARGAQRPMT